MESGGRLQRNERRLHELLRHGDGAVGEFYAGIYNMTPAHMDDVHAAIIEHPDLQVLTPSGGERRKANAINVGDTLRMKLQRSFFPLFFSKDHP